MLLSISVYAGEITVAVAANVSYAMEAIQKAFSQESPETKVHMVVGSSGKLTAQIHHGAPYQLFLSADMRYPERLYQTGFALTTPVVYAEGALALFAVEPYAHHRGLALLADDKIEKIAVANPKTAPYGIATKEALVTSGLYRRVQSKFVYGESISQTVAYVERVVDIGVVAKSSLFSPQMAHYRQGVHWSEVDSKLYTPISQGMVILKEGKGNKEVEAFYYFMQSEKVKKILKSFGYKVL